MKYLLLLSLLTSCSEESPKCHFGIKYDVYLKHFNSESCQKCRKYANVKACNICNKVNYSDEDYCN